MKSRLGTGFALRNFNVYKNGNSKNECNNGRRAFYRRIYRGCGRRETLIVVGSLHGNEKGGAAALRKISRELENLPEKFRGRVYFLAGNTRALQRGVRFIDADLNRHWTIENLTKNSLDTTVSPQLSEHLEHRGLLEILNKILAARDEVYALDLHSTSAEGLPFATVGDTLRNRGFAQKFPVAILLGIEEKLDGTLLEYFNRFGVHNTSFLLWIFRLWRRNQFLTFPPVQNTFHIEIKF